MTVTDAGVCSTGTVAPEREAVMTTVPSASKPASAGAAARKAAKEAIT
jgi:hypothetical protein